MEKHYIRTMPLGKDRFHNRFWFFFREGRLFVESDDCKRWGYYSAKEEVTAFQVSVVQNIPLILLIFCCLPLSMIFFFLPSLHNFQQAFCVCAAGCLIQLLEYQRDQGESFAQANGDSIRQDQVSCLFVSKSVLELVHHSEPSWRSCSSYGVVCISASVSSVGMQRL